jgi:arylsulfatase A-like enzyme
VKRGFGWIAAFAVLAGVGCRGGAGTADEAGGAPERAQAAGNRLNVLLITIDTLRADHMSLYGYSRETTPRLDALAKVGVTFDRAYTYWPKTRGSFVAMMTGRLAAGSGYGKTHPLLLDFNPTLAGLLKGAGYDTVAVVDNPNVAASLGYAKGFGRYRETWEEEALPSEVDRARAITEDAVRFLQEARAERPFFLWLHYVNPHAPYTPPSPFDTRFLDEEALRGPAVPAVDGFNGGVSRPWEVPGRGLGYYVAQYDGEIAVTDAEVGRVLAALELSEVGERTLVILTSDHGESLGEHDYFFDHGQNLYDPSMRIPLVMAGPGLAVGHRSEVLATTLDLVPTVLDAVKVSYPPGLDGRSLLGSGKGRPGPRRPRLFGQNDRNLLAWDGRFKIVATPTEEGADYALYDRERDPGETRDVGAQVADELRAQREALERFRTRIDAQTARTRRLMHGRSGEERLSPEACEKLRAMGYIQQACS